MAPFTVITRVPIPASLPPRAVIEALQSYEALITPNPYLDRYERRPVPVEDVVADPFFRADGGSDRLQAFVVYDRVPIIPGLGAWACKEVAIPCTFQSFERGVRCRADAQGGVTVRSSYEVRRRREVGEGPAGPGDGDGDQGDGDYELVDISEIECGALVRPFVKLRFESGHREILRRVVDNLLQSGGSSHSRATRAGATGQ